VLLVGIGHMFLAALLLCFRHEHRKRGATSLATRGKEARRA
jgi:hypothetical protein